MQGRPIPEALVRAAVLPPAQGTDAELLGRFVSARDPGAFGELVSRHGPMVLGVCRRALGNTPDADDAFQAVWLVLVRKAESVSPRGKVGHWLYGVAVRTATHARARNAKRHLHQRDLPDLLQSSTGRGSDEKQPEDGDIADSRRRVPGRRINEEGAGEQQG